VAAAIRDWCRFMGMGTAYIGPGSAWQNGVEERSGGYVKSNGLKGRRLEGGLEEINAHLQRWNRTVAQLRIHGTTRQQVLAHFLAVESPALKPLPAERFSLFEVGTRTVHPDGHVEVAGAFYSVPHHLIGRRVRVHWHEHLVRIYLDGQAVAVHSRGPAGSWSTRPRAPAAAQGGVPEHLGGQPAGQGRADRGAGPGLGAGGNDGAGGPLLPRCSRG
jgi:hypothetical protein